MLALRNPHKRPVTLILQHPDAPRHSTAFTSRELNPRTGEYAERNISLQLPESLTLLPGEVRSVPDHAEAAAKRLGLQITRQQEPPKPQEPAAASANPAPQESAPEGAEKE